MTVGMLNHHSQMKALQVTLSTTYHLHLAKNVKRQHRGKPESISRSQKLLNVFVESDDSTR